MPNDETMNQRTALAALTGAAAVGGLLFMIGVAAYLLMYWHFT
jgi:hypothetical protein